MINESLRNKSTTEFCILLVMKQPNYLVTLSIVDTCSISITLERFCLSYLFKYIVSLNGMYV